MSVERAKGTAWENAVVEALRFAGWAHVERRALSGKNDRGDIAGIPGLVIECKSVRTIKLSEFVDEANVEAFNDGAQLGVAWIKRRGKASALSGYVVMDGATFVEILHRMDV